MFGNWPDYLNDDSWEGGYTGTMSTNGVSLGSTLDDVQIGDVALYGDPISHAAMYVGNGLVSFTSRSTNANFTRLFPMVPALKALLIQFILLLGITGLQ